MRALYFYLEQPFRYFVIDHLKEGSVLIESGACEELEQIKEKADLMEMNIAILSGELVSIMEVNIPIKSRAKAMKAIPFALEDQLADNIEDLHFELLNWLPGETSTVAVINDEQWQSYRQQLSDSQIELHRIIVDFDLLPLPENVAACIYEDSESERVLLKFRKADIVQGIAIEKSELPYWADEFDIENKTILSNNVENVYGMFTDESIASANISAFSANTIEDLCQSSTEAQFDLALFASNQSKQSSRKSRPWLIGAVCFLVLASFVNIGMDVYEYLILKKKSQVLNDRIEQTFKTSFPHIDRIVDPQLQFQREIELLQGNAKGTDEFLFLLDKLISSFSRNAGEITEMFYRNSGLDVVFRMRNFQRVDQFDKRFAAVSANTAEATRLSSDSQGGIVTAKYRITIAGQSDE